MSRGKRDQAAHPGLAPPTLVSTGVRAKLVPVEASDTASIFELLARYDKLVRDWADLCTDAFELASHQKPPNRSRRRAQKAR